MADRSAVEITMTSRNKNDQAVPESTQTLRPLEQYADYLDSLGVVILISGEIRRSF